jgi:hypothetical protein
MKVPGRAWLEFETRPEGSGCRLRQTAEFDPLGLLGLAYWYALYPIHQVVFAGMLRELGRSIVSPGEAAGALHDDRLPGSLDADFRTGPR